MSEVVGVCSGIQDLTEGYSPAIAYNERTVAFKMWQDISCYQEEL